VERVRSSAKFGHPMSRLSHVRVSITRHRHAAQLRLWQQPAGGDIHHHVGDCLYLCNSTDHRAWAVLDDEIRRDGLNCTA
jgi:hypothetical protein